jgi:hypothetical protein
MSMGGVVARVGVGGVITVPKGIMPGLGSRVPFARVRV